MAESRTEDSLSENSMEMEAHGAEVKMATVKTEELEAEVGFTDGDKAAQCRGEEDVGAAGGSSVDTNGIDRLLQQHRKEIMFELRRLQLGDRPVTGQENRKNVEDFFRRSTDPQAAQAAREETRPEEVVVEVRALVDRRPVSSLLQSTAFRQNLESRLRSSLGAARTPSPRITQRRPTPAPRQRTTVPPPPPPIPTNLGESRPNTQSSLQASLTRVRTTLPPPPPALHPGSDSEEDDDVMETPPTSPRERPATTHSVRPDPVPIAPTLPPVAPEERARAWLRQQLPAAFTTNSLWDSLEQSHRESIISEISELVQQQLVTSTLSGDFRNTLEHHMTNRLQSSGTDGRRVQQVINSLPRIPAHMRNNFSELGISAPHGAAAHHDNLSDSVSVISATAAVTIPHAQSTAVMSREIGSLKAQMEELKNMMKLSFDLQLDIQRAIRQEVSAAVNTALATERPQAGPETAAVGGTRLSSRPADSSKCVICLEKGADAVLYKCGHLCLCYTCGLNLRQRGSNCPVCRAPIQDIIRTYVVGNTD